jgi:5-methylcytosine-specific restriction endonuclease McrA
MIDVGTTFEDALVETCVDPDVSRPRVRPLHEELPSDWRVEFPRTLREKNPIGTRFRCNLLVCQKHNKDDSVRGQPYLRADKSSIVRIEDYTPERAIHAILNSSSISERSYSYIDLGELTGNDLESIRQSALKVSSESHLTESETNRYSRSDRVKAYVRFRANGICECCDEIAPFISRNGEPYLEVHHINDLSKGGEDSIFNTAAICPNCHSEITHGVDGSLRNESLRSRIKKKESNADRTSIKPLTRAERAKADWL